MKKKVTETVKKPVEKKVVKKPVEFTRKNKDGEVITIKKVEGKKQYEIVVTTGKMVAKITLNNTQAKAVLKDLEKALAAE